MKTCPECLELLLASASVCPTCGHVFPKHKKEFRLFLGDVNGDEETAHIVENWTWMTKTSKKGFLMWIVTYKTQVITSDEGESMVKEYLVIDDNASYFARKKAFERMKELSLVAKLDYNQFIREDKSIDFESWGKAIAKSEMPAALVTIKDGDFTRITATFSNEEIQTGMRQEFEENELMEQTKRRITGDIE